MTGRPVVVVGAGTTGAGIAVSLADIGVEVIVTEAGPEAAEAARARLGPGMDVASQLDAIQSGVSGRVERVEITGARNSVYLDARDVVLGAVSAFVARTLTPRR